MRLREERAFPPNAEGRWLLGWRGLLVVAKGAESSVSPMASGEPLPLPLRTAPPPPPTNSQLLQDLEQHSVCLAGGRVGSGPLERNPGKVREDCELAPELPFPPHIDLALTEHQPAIDKGEGSWKMAVPRLLDQEGL